jgi:hypothetical protein
MDLSPFFYIAITVYYLLVLITFLQATTFYHSIHLILCSHQTGEIDNLTVSWDKVLGCVVCRFHVAPGAKLHADKLSGAIVRSVAKLAGINLWKFGSFSYWFDKSWFHNWGKTCWCAHHNLLLGFPTRQLYIYIIPTSTPHHQQVFWRRCRGERRFLQGESLTSNLLLCYCFALLYFCLHCFIKNTKK